MKLYFMVTRRPDQHPEMCCSIEGTRSGKGDSLRVVELIKEREEKRVHASIGTITGEAS